MNHLKNYLTCLLLIATIALSAQAPEGINYQAVARDNGGAVLVNENLTVRMTIKENGPAGTTVFQETHNVSTNDFGLFDLTIGQGSVVTGTFSNLNWGSSSHFLQVEVDDGSGYVNLGTSQFVSVPYALYAKSAGGGGGSYSAGTGIDISGNVISNTGDTDASDDVTTSSTAGGDASGTFSNLTIVGLQGRSVSSSAPSSGEVLKWNGSTWAPANDVGGGSGDNWGTQVVQTDATLSGNGVSGNSLGIAQQGASSGQVLKWNGSAWVPDADNNTNTTYSAGIGLSLSGTTFSNTGDTDASDDITTSTAAGGDLSGTYPDPSVSGLQGNQLNASNPKDGEVLQWDNATSRWINAPMESSPWMTNGSDIYYNTGNVGIGINSPEFSLSVAQDKGWNYVGFKTSGTGFTNSDGSFIGVSSQDDMVLYNREASDIRFATSSKDRMVISSFGRVGIGTSSPDNDLVIESTSPFLELHSTGGNAGIKFEENSVSTGWVWHNSSNNDLVLSGNAAGSAHITITENGNVGLGTYNASFPFELSGDTMSINGIELANLGSNTLGLDGDVVPYANTSFDVGNNVAGEHWDDVVANDFVTFSDARKKQNIQSMNYGLLEILALNTYTYQLTPDMDASGDQRFGVMAQDLQQVIPELVVSEDVDVNPETGEVERKKTDVLGVKYMEMIPILIKGIQEQQEIIEQLKQRIEQLEAE